MTKNSVTHTVTQPGLFPETEIPSKGGVKVFKPGTTCYIGFDKETVKATILEVLISTNGDVKYHCAWWSSNNRNTAWVHEHEISIRRPLPVVNIGFKAT